MDPLNVGLGLGLDGGGMGNRTPDIQLAKLTLYQLSYTPSKRRLISEG
jgi:hypothetical protein